MFLIPLVTAALLLILGAGIAIYILEVKYLPRIGLSLYDLHIAVEQNEDLFQGFETFVWIYIGAVGTALLLTIVFTNVNLTRELFTHISEPLDTLVGGVDRIRSGDLDNPINYTEPDEFKAACDHLYLMTDDGSYGEHGFVTVKLQQLLEAGTQYDEVLAIGPIPMMKFVSKTTEPFGVKTIVSLNPIMVDGTGMCGGCRVTVGGEVKFACVDGPDFDGHKVDYAELMNRNGVYREREAEVRQTHKCRLEKLGEELIK